MSKFSLIFCSANNQSLATLHSGHPITGVELLNDDSFCFFIVHLKGAIMRHIDLNVMDPAQCEQTLNERYRTLAPHYNQNTLCGYSDNDQCKV